jgi:AcrR family transcriptional regulator
MKDAILGAAIEVVALHGLNNWTVEEVANRARCAKGLVNYHYRSKQDLLVQVAETIRDDRAAHRLAAIQLSGARALDRLWETLGREMESGWFAAWLSLLAADGPLRTAASSTPKSSRTFALALGRALDVGDQLVPRATLIEATLDGLQLGLLQGASQAATEEDYHRFWLTVLP